jgi:hypothetical protein
MSGSWLEAIVGAELQSGQQAVASLTCSGKYVGAELQERGITGRLTVSRAALPLTKELYARPSSVRELVETPTHLPYCRRRERCDATHAGVCINRGRYTADGVRACVRHKPPRYRTPG